MFCRAKVNGPNTYIQIVENQRDGKKVRQRVIATLGRLDHLQKTGALERLLQSACRFSEQLMVLAAQPGSGDGEDGAEVRHIGPAPINSTHLSPCLLLLPVCFRPSRAWREWR